MPLRWRGLFGLSLGRHADNSRWVVLGLFVSCLAVASAMSPARIGEMRRQTVAMFYHGFDNYMDVAFPEDEVRFFVESYNELLLSLL